MGDYRKAVAYALSGALVASQIECAAATPLPTNVATMKSMVANLETPVYWRGSRGLGSRSGLVRGRRGRRSHRQRCVWLLWRAVLLWISIPTLQLRLFVQLFLFARLLRMHYVLRIPSSLL